jgi:diguanylate cyclase (GGDEF)-like protein/PAS domain S-box-containing protein
MFYVSPGYLDLWGRSCESLYADPRSFTEAIHADDRERAIQSFAPDGIVIPFDVEYRVVRPDGTVRWIRARGFPIRDESGDVYRFAGIAEDVTERRSALDLVTSQAHSLELSNRRLSLLGEMTGLLQTVVRVEEAAAIVGGYLAQVCVGASGALYLYKESRNYLDLLARWGELKLANRVMPDECWALRRGQPYRPSGAQPELRCRHAQVVDGPCAYLCLPMMVEGGALGLLHVVSTDASPDSRDDDALFAQRMSEQLGLALANFRLRETLRLEAMQDPLTGLYNRRFLEVSLKREFARAARENNSVAVMMLDVDHFKRFNDTHGHDAGDVVLRQLGRVVTENCRAADLACRFGGEEFTMVLPGATRESTTHGAERLLKAVRGMKVIADGRVLPKLTVSIGIALFPEHGDEATSILHAADQALYAAKEAGRDRYVFSTVKPGTGGGA